MRINLDIALVRSFVAVAISSNMTTASQMLGLTQGAVSQQIGRLEDLLDCKLFDRSQRRLRLTANGERFLAQGKRLLDLNDSIVSDLRTPLMHGTIRFGVPDDLITSYLPMALRGFSDAFPKVEIALHCDTSPNLIAAIEKGTLDLAIVEEPIDGIRGECLATEPLVWIGCQNGKAHGKRPLPLTTVAETCVFKPALHHALTEANIPWRTVSESGSLAATMAILRADLAVSASLASAAPKDLAILVADLGLPPLPSFSISLHGLGRTKNVLITELGNHIRRAFAQRAVPGE